MAQKFANATVIITGASAGIGAEAARLFAQEGANLVIAARGEAKLEEVARRLEAQGARVLAVPTDVADVDACERLIERTVEVFGGIDVLVNNAGMHARGEVDAQSARTLGQMIDVNLRGPVVLSRFALSYLRVGRGSIVNVASLAGRLPLPGSAVYSSTKFGLRVLSFAMAEELRGSNVKISVVSPGPVATDFILNDPAVTDLTFSQPMSTAEDIAEAILACAVDGKAERVCPASSAPLTTLAYLAPSIARTLRPMLKRKGRKARKRYLDVGKK